MGKKGKIFVGVLATAAIIGAGVGTAIHFHNAGAFKYPGEDAIALATLNWNNVETDRNYVIASKDDTAKTAILGYYNDDSEYVKAPKSIEISGTAYTVSGIIFTDPSGFQSGGKHWSGNYNLYVKAVMIPNTIKEITKESFYGVSSLVLVDIPDSVTSIGDSSFQGCTALAKVDIPDSVTSIGASAFFGCTALAKVDIPDSVTSISDHSFLDCTALAKVDIPDSVTSIGASAFLGCTALAKVDIPDSVTSISDYSFRDCTALAKVDIPDSVTSIGDSSFRDCTALAKVDIPDSVTSIGTSAFFGCTALAKVDIPTLISEVKAYSFFGLKKGSPVRVENMHPTVDESTFYPDQPVFFDAYKSNVAWATLATERTKDDQKVYYAGQWELKNGVPTPNGKEATAAPAAPAASTATSSAAA